MKKTFALIGLFTLIALASFANGGDSTKVIHEGDKKFVVHKVMQGENLYSIAKQYSVNISDITSNNEVQNFSVKPGQELMIPCENCEVVSEQFAVSSEQNPEITDPIIIEPKSEIINQQSEIKEDVAEIVTEPVVVEPKTEIISQQAEIKEEPVQYITKTEETKVTHVVQAGETLYGVSKKYGVTVEQIQQWNSMTATGINTGQKLIIVQMKEVTVRVDHGEVGTVGEEIMNPIVETPNANSSLEEIFASYLTEENVIQQSRGMSVWIHEDNANSNKYYCFHNSAPIGSVLKVKNLVNNEEVLLKVIGKIPETTENKNAMIRVSYLAAQDMGVLDDKFVVEVTRYVSKNQSQASR